MSKETIDKLLFLADHIENSYLTEQRNQQGEILENNNNIFI